MKWRCLDVFGSRVVYIRIECSGTAGVYVKGSKIVVNLCTERINLRNFWYEWFDHEARNTTD